MWPFSKKKVQSVSVMVNCLTIGCAGTPHNLSASNAIALIDFERSRDPDYRLTLSCSHCGATHKYAKEAIIGMIPESARPRPLDAQDFWGVVLMEVPTDDGLPYRAFLGDRVLLRRLSGTPQDGEAKVVSRSVLASTLALGDRVRYERSGTCSVCVAVGRGNKWEPIAFVPKGRAGTTGVFVKPKHGSEPVVPANVECANPSCSTVFSTTHSSLQSQFRAGAEQRAAAGHRAMMLMTCNACGTSRCLDEHTFDGYAKI